MFGNPLFHQNWNDGVSNPALEVGGKLALLRDQKGITSWMWQSHGSRLLNPLFQLAGSFAHNTLS